MRHFKVGTYDKEIQYREFHDTVCIQTTISILRGSVPPLHNVSMVTYARISASSSVDDYVTVSASSSVNKVT